MIAQRNPGSWMYSAASGWLMSSSEAGRRRHLSCRSNSLLVEAISVRVTAAYGTQASAAAMPLVAAYVAIARALSSCTLGSFGARAPARRGTLNARA
jgi:hypothetical protein